MNSSPFLPAAPSTLNVGADDPVRPSFDFPPHPVGADAPSSAHIFEPILFFLCQKEKNGFNLPRKEREQRAYRCPEFDSENLSHHPSVASVPTFRKVSALCASPFGGAAQQDQHLRADEYPQGAGRICNAPSSRTAALGIGPYKLYRRFFDFHTPQVQSKALADRRGVGKPYGRFPHALFSFGGSTPFPFLKEKRKRGRKFPFSE